MAVFLFLLMFTDEAPFLEGSWQEVSERAVRENKLVIVDVYTEWCGPCKRLDKVTWKHEKVRNYLSNQVVGFKVDAEKGEGVAFSEKYGVSGYPCLLIVDPKDGKVISRWVGYLTPAAFMRWVEGKL